MSISTDDCRKFIAEFQARNPQIKMARFDGDLDDEARSALTNPRNWKRRYKVRPSAQTDEHDPMESYTVYGDGMPVNRYAEGQVEVDAKTIAWECKFDCEPFDGQVAYLILETHDGKLLFGNYAGD